MYLSCITYSWQYIFVIKSFEQLKNYFQQCLTHCLGYTCAVIADVTAGIWKWSAILASWKYDCLFYVKMENYMERLWYHTGT